MLYPGLALGAIVSRASRISDGMFVAAANAVSSLVTVRQPGASLLPQIDDLRSVSATVAVGGGRGGGWRKAWPESSSTISFNRCRTRCGSRNIAASRRSDASLSADSLLLLALRLVRSAEPQAPAVVRTISDSPSSVDLVALQATVHDREGRLRLRICASRISRSTKTASGKPSGCSGTKTFRLPSGWWSITAASMRPQARCM